MKKNILVLLASVALISIFGIGYSALAQVQIDPSLHPEAAPTFNGEAPLAPTAPTDPNSPALAQTMLNDFVSRILNVIFAIAGFIAIYSIANNGWYLIISAGAEEQLTQHKKGLMWSVIGLIAIILAYSIISFIIAFPFNSGQTPEFGPQTEQAVPAIGGGASPGGGMGPSGAGGVPESPAL